MRIIGTVIREGSALLLAVALWVYNSNFTGHSPTMDTPEDGMRIMFLCAFVGLVYLVLQGGTLAFGRIGTSVALITDMVASIVPVGVAGYSLIYHAQGHMMLSPFQWYLSWLVAAFAIYDVVVNGGLWARINRFVSEYHPTQGSTAPR